MINPADYHTERFFCQLRVLAHPCMVMKAGYHGGKMMLLAPVPLYDVSGPSIMMVTTYDNIGSPTGSVVRPLPMRAHSVAMEQVHYLFRTEAEVKEAFGSFVWNWSGAPWHDELGPLVRSNKHYVDDDVVAPVQVQYLSAESSAEEGRGNGPKPTPPPVVSAEMQRTQAMEEKMTRRSRR